MSAQVETMAYAGRVPWHGLGVPVEDTMTPEEMLEAADLNWTVSKRPAYTLTSPEWSDETTVMQTEGHYFIVRDSDNTVLSACGNDYVPFQNADTFKFFKKFVSAGDMKMETAGSLKNGQDIWGLAKLECSFELAGGDKVEGYLLIDSPHVSGIALTIMFTPIRVVCANTIAMALNTDGNKFRVLHLQAFDGDIIKAAETALGISSELMEDFRIQTEFLSSRTAKHTEVQNYVAELFQPKLLIERGKMEIANDMPLSDEFSRTADQVYESIYNSPGSDLSSAKDTWWGVFNGVTYFIDHKKRENERILGGALYSSWLGQGAATKRKALGLATEYADAA